MTDEELEVEIDRQYYLVLAAETDEELRERFNRMADLIARRSSHQVQRMEREQGLG
jgi:hypothetical protein